MPHDKMMQELFVGDQVRDTKTGETGKLVRMEAACYCAVEFDQKHVIAPANRFEKIPA